MEDDQQFCLRWNNHQSTLIQNFDTLLESGTLVDCTLAAEGKYLKAHKVVLSACSPYFEGLLSEHYDKHPVFILKDVKFKELKAMMDYMYRGEVNISQDQLTALLKAAESLQIKGLSDSRTGGGSTTTTGKTDSTRSAKIASSASVDIPHTSSGLSMEKISKVPRQNLQQVSVTELPEDSASPQLKGISSREGSQSPTRKRKRLRRRSLGNEDTNQSMENHEASNSSDILSTPTIRTTPIIDDKIHVDPTEPIGRSALMQQLTKQPVDELLQIPLEKPEPSEEMIQPKSEYVDDQESVEDLTHLDDDMNDLNEMEDSSRAGPSHDTSQHSGIAPWHITGDRSSSSVVTGTGTPGAQDEVFLAAHDAAQAQRDSQAYNRRDLQSLCIKVHNVKSISDKEMDEINHGVILENPLARKIQHIRKFPLSLKKVSDFEDYSWVSHDKSSNGNEFLTRKKDRTFKISQFLKMNSIKEMKRKRGRPRKNEKVKEANSLATRTSLRMTHRPNYLETSYDDIEPFCELYYPTEDASTENFQLKEKQQSYEEQISDDNNRHLDNANALKNKQELLVIQKAHHAVENVKKKRGRPRKITHVPDAYQITIKRKRGRPRKSEDFEKLTSGTNATDLKINDSLKSSRSSENIKIGASQIFLPISQSDSRIKNISSNKSKKFSYEPIFSSNKDLFKFQEKNHELFETKKKKRGRPPKICEEISPCLMINTKIKRKRGRPRKIEKELYNYNHTQNILNTNFANKITKIPLVSIKNEDQLCIEFS